jgi:hypothetical protein
MNRQIELSQSPDIAGETSFQQFPIRRNTDHVVAETGVDHPGSITGFPWQASHVSAMQDEIGDQRADGTALGYSDGFIQRIYVKFLQSVKMPINSVVS